MASIVFFASFICTIYASPQQENVCPLLGAIYPAPQNLCTEALIQSTGTELSTILQQMSTAGNISTAYGHIDFGATSFSINLFSAQEDDSSFQYHHAAPVMATAVNGTKIIDIDTVYRLGSVTKLLTVWLFLIKAGDVYFNQPITQYVPELLTAAELESTNATAIADNVDFVRWSDVTIGELASHMAGLDKERRCLTSSFIRP